MSASDATRDNKDELERLVVGSSAYMCAPKVRLLSCQPRPSLNVCLFITDRVKVVFTIFTRSVQVLCSISTQSL